jgi:hypothetical protein
MRATRSYWFSRALSKCGLRHPANRFVTRTVPKGRVFMFPRGVQEAPARGGQLRGGADGGGHGAHEVQVPATYEAEVRRTLSSHTQVIERMHGASKRAYVRRLLSVTVPSWLQSPATAYYGTQLLLPHVRTTHLSSVFRWKSVSLFVHSPVCNSGCM